MLVHTVVEHELVPSTLTLVASGKVRALHVTTHTDHTGS